MTTPVEQQITAWNQALSHVNHLTGEQAQQIAATAADGQSVYVRELDDGTFEVRQQSEVPEAERSNYTLVNLTNGANRGERDVLNLTETAHNAAADTVGFIEREGRRREGEVGDNDDSVVLEADELIQFEAQHIQAAANAWGITIDQARGLYYSGSFELGSENRAEWVELAEARETYVSGLVARYNQIPEEQRQEQGAFLTWLGTDLEIDPDNPLCVNLGVYSDEHPNASPEELANQLFVNMLASNCPAEQQTTILGLNEAITGSAYNYSEGRFSVDSIAAWCSREVEGTGIPPNGPDMVFTVDGDGNETVEENVADIATRTDRAGLIAEAGAAFNAGRDAEESTDRQEHFTRALELYQRAHELQQTPDTLTIIAACYHLMGNGSMAVTTLQALQSEYSDFQSTMSAELIDHYDSDLNPNMIFNEAGEMVFNNAEAGSDEVAANGHPVDGIEEEVDEAPNLGPNPAQLAATGLEHVRARRWEQALEVHGQLETRFPNYVSADSLLFNAVLDARRVAQGLPSGRRRNRLEGQIIQALRGRVRIDALRTATLNAEREHRQHVANQAVRARRGNRVDLDQVMARPIVEGEENLDPDIAAAIAPPPEPEVINVDNRRVNLREALAGLPTIDLPNRGTDDVLQIGRIQGRLNLALRGNYRPNPPVATSRPQHNPQPPAPRVPRERRNVDSDAILAQYEVDNFSAWLASEYGLADEAHPQDQVEVAVPTGRRPAPRTNPNPAPPPSPDPAAVDLEAARGEVREALPNLGTTIANLEALQRRAEATGNREVISMVQGVLRRAQDANRHLVAARAGENPSAVRNELRAANEVFRGVTSSLGMLNLDQAVADAERVANARPQRQASYNAAIRWEAEENQPSNVTDLVAALRATGDTALETLATNIERANSQAIAAVRTADRFDARLRDLESRVEVGRSRLAARVNTPAPQVRRGAPLPVRPDPNDPNAFSINRGEVRSQIRVRTQRVFERTARRIHLSSDARLRVRYRRTNIDGDRVTFYFQVSGSGNSEAVATAMREVSVTYSRNDETPERFQAQINAYEQAMRGVWLPGVFTPPGR